MSEENELWELVRKRVNGEEPSESFENIEERIEESAIEESVKE